MVRLAVGDGVEGVARAEGAEFGAFAHCLLDFFNGMRRVHVVGMVAEVSGPVGFVGNGLCRGCRRCLSGGFGDLRKEGAGYECAGSLQELPLIHFRTDLLGALLGMFTECRDSEADGARLGE